MGRDYRNIKAWQLADRLAIDIYNLTSTFPRHEIFGLTQQIRKAAISVPANIAEGANRGHKKDYLRFLFIAKGSLGEVEYFLHLCHELRYLEKDVFEKTNSFCLETAKTLYGLIESVKSEI